MEIISKDKYIQRDYEEMIAKGTAPKLAEMLALQSPPSCNTDTRFMTGEWGSERYSHQLARFPGDPQARVSSRADVLRIAKERGMAIEGGGFSYTPPDYGLAEDSGTYEVADDIVEDAIADIVDEHPEAARDPDLRENLKTRFSGGIPEEE